MDVKPYLVHTYHSQWYQLKSKVLQYFRWMTKAPNLSKVYFNEKFEFTLDPRKLNFKICNSVKLGARSMKDFKTI